VLKEGSQKLGAFFHGYTYSGHPVGAAVGLANLEIFEKENLIARAKENGIYLHEQLQSLLNLPNVGEIRGEGLIAGVQLVADKSSRTLPDAAAKIPMNVTKLMLEKGVIIRPLATVATLAISPPLTISKDEIDRLVQMMSESIAAQV
jgi:adenosylmethionine-8-amino-7-oxononanoate aminotransferase